MAEFDPNQPYEVLDDTGPAQFDPNQPYEVLDQESKSGVGELAGTAREAAFGVVPMLGSIAGGALGAAAGAPFGGVGSIPGAFAGGYAGGEIASKAQDWLLDKLGLGPDSATGRSRAAFAQEHPYEAFAGGLAPMVGAMRFDRAATALGRLASGAAMGGFEAATQPEFDPAKIAMAAGAGALFPSENRVGAVAGGLGRRLGVSIGERLGETFPQAAARGQRFDEWLAARLGRGREEDASAATGEVPGGRPQQEAREAGKTAEEQAAETRINPAGPIAARGTAEAKPPPTDNPDADVPGATFQVGRSAREYPKATAPVAPSAPESLIDPTIKAATDALNLNPPRFFEPTALSQWQPRPPAAAPPPPVAPEPPNYQPHQPMTPEASRLREANVKPSAQELADILRVGTQRAMQLPLKIVPMPTIANSSKLPGGPIYIDPRVPPNARQFLAVHEQLEKVLIARGFSPDEAHRIATQGERAAVERAGVNWNSYSNLINKVRPAIEAQRGKVPVPADVHISVDESMGHHAKEPDFVGPEKAQQLAQKGSDREKVRTYLEGRLGRPVTDAQLDNVLGPAERKPLQLKQPVAPRTAETMKRRFGEQTREVEPAVTLAAAEPPAISPRTAEFQNMIDRMRAKGNEEGAKRLEAIATRKDQDAALEAAKKAAGERARAFRKPGQSGRDRVTDAAKQQARDAATKAYEGYPPPEGKEETNGELISRLHAAMDTARDANAGNPKYALATDLKYQTEHAGASWLQRAAAVLRNPTRKGVVEKFRVFEKDLRGGTSPREAGAIARTEADIARRRRPTAEQAQGAEPEIRTGEGHEAPGEPAVEVAEPAAERQEPTEAALPGEQEDALDRLHALPVSKLRQIVARKGVDPQTIARMSADDLRPRIARLMQLGQIKPEEIAMERPVLERGRGGRPTRSGPLPGKPEEIVKKIGERTYKPSQEKIEGRQEQIDLLRENRLLLSKQPQTADTQRQIREINDQLAKLERLPEAEDLTKTFGIDLEAGAGEITPNLKDEARRALGLPSKLAGERVTPDPRLTAADIAYEKARALDDHLYRLEGLTTGDYQEFFGHLEQTKKEFPKELGGKGGEEIYHAIENGTYKDLPKKQRESYENVIARWDDQIEKDRLFLKNRGKLEKTEDDPNYMHRILRTGEAREKFFNLRDPITGQIPGQAKPPEAHELQFMGATAADGTRKVISSSPEAITIWENGRKTSIYNPKKSSGERSYVGDKFTLNGKEYTIDRGLTKDIEEHARHDDGSRIKYVDNALVSKMQEALDLRARRAFVEAMDFIRESPLLNSVRTASRDDPRLEKNGGTFVSLDHDWAPQELRDLHADPDLAAAIHNNNDPTTGGNGFNWLRMFNQYAVRGIFWNPVPHALNTTMHYAVSRGWDWLPRQGNYKRLGESFRKAMNDVLTQNENLQELNRAGAPLIMSRIDKENLLGNVSKLFGQDYQLQPAKWEEWARKYGLGKGIDAVTALYNGSRKLLWTASDVLMAARIYELEAKGMDRATAIREAARHIPDYRVPLRFLGKAEFARAMADNKWFAFGRYHMGMVNSLLHMSRDAIKGTPEERREAFGNLAALGFFGLVLYPIIDKGIQLVTGNKDAEFTRRGPFAPLEHLVKAAMGKESYSRTTSGVLSLSPGADIAKGLLTNEDYFKREIAQTGSSLPMKAMQIGDYVAQRAVSPYGEFSQTLMPTSRGPGPVTKLAQDLLNVKTPTEGQLAGKRYGETRIRSEERTRQKRPHGLIEYGAQQLGM